MFRGRPGLGPRPGQTTVTNMAKGSGKRRGSLSQTARAPKPSEPAKPAWDVSESRSVKSGWIWRGFLMLALFALGITIVLFGLGHRYQTFAILWAIITVGWFGISMWLWRKHTQYVRS
jgi:hypothetical protein